MKGFILSVALLFSASSFANEVADLVKVYNSQQFVNFLSGEKDRQDDCYPLPDRQSCVKFGCSTVRRFECNDQHEIQRMFEACKGNYGDTCLRKAVSFLRSFEFDDLDEMEELANGCRGLFDVSCVDFVCQRLGTFKCDDRQEIIAVLSQCKY
ncbi:MAG: hypothetical protein Fur0010_01870 [Bdellovibrio sp.]